MDTVLEKQRSLVGLYLVVALPLLRVSESWSKPCVRTACQLFVLGVIDMVRSVNKLEWPQFIVLLDRVLLDHDLAISVECTESFVERAGKAARASSVVADIVDEGAKSIRSWVATRDVDAPDDVMRVALYAQKHAEQLSGAMALPQDDAESPQTRGNSTPAGQYVSRIPVNDSPVAQCIREARSIKLKVVEKQLAALSVAGSSWSSWQGPLSGVVLFDRHANARTIVKQIVFLPIILIVIPILALMALFDYVAHLRKRARMMAALRDEIRRLRSCPLPLGEASVGTLDALWSLHGLENDPLSFHDDLATWAFLHGPHNDVDHSEMALNLLCQWVDILYGTGRSVDLKIHERAREIERQMGEANRPYYEGQKGAPHYHFGSPLESLIKELSDELPPFSVYGSCRQSPSVSSLPLPHA